MTREQRDRMAESFVTVYDALQRAAVPTYMVSLRESPRLPRPRYLPDVPQQTPSEYRTALAKLGKFGILKAN